MRSHWRPKASSRPPTTSEADSIGITFSAGPSATTSAASTIAAAPTPRRGRAPAAHDADREDDRQRLDRFDRARDERRQEEQDVGAHQSAVRGHVRLLGLGQPALDPLERDGVARVIAEELRRLLPRDARSMRSQNETD